MFHPEVRNDWSSSGSSPVQSMVLSIRNNQTILLAISLKAVARYSACESVIPYVLNFHTFVAPGMIPTIPFPFRALEKKNPRFL